MQAESLLIFDLNIKIYFPNRFAVVQQRVTYWADQRTVAIAQVGATPGPTTVGPTGSKWIRNFQKWDTQN